MSAPLFWRRAATAYVVVRIVLCDDERPAIFCRDVAGLELDGIRTDNPSPKSEPLRLVDCPDAYIRLGPSPKP